MDADTPPPVPAAVPPGPTNSKSGASSLPATEILPSTGLALLPVPAPESIEAAESAQPARKRARGSTRRVASRASAPRAPAAPLAPGAAVAADLQAIGVPALLDDDDLDALNNDYCDACHGRGRFLCCDGCPRSFHFGCVCPPLDIDEMPFPNGTLLPKKEAPPKDARAARALADDSWFCQVCFAERKPPSVPQGCGPFGVLLRQLATENPRMFALPADLRSYFKGVGTAADGAYLDTTVQRPLKLNRQGFMEDRDPFQLRDKQGEPILCFRCGQSALPREAVTVRHGESVEMAERRAIASAHANGKKRAADAPGRRMLSCDFCTLHWHLDCVQPALSSMPPATRRWRCPAHSSHGQPRMRIPRAPQAVHSVTVPPDAPLPDTKDALVDVVLDAHDRTFDAETGAGHSRTQPWEDVSVDTGTKRMRFRIPEKTIRLAFWAAARDRRGTVPRAPPETHAPRLDILSQVAQGIITPPPAPPPLQPVPTPTGAAHAEHAAALASSWAPNGQPFAPAERTSYARSDAEPLVPVPTDTLAAPRPPAEIENVYVYPAEIAELRELKRWVLQHGGWEGVH
ncbi:hypothetical protein MCAP1_003559 [Malassezia caprae]|uniref:PHD-type domain-containing protein n=1 Tax=Malassezia caprae TaxID=1381934 RepID=A0AAF0E8U7_9BASI|nr:hypothetical protein MCAP1_003559 [Malassezia caprae]